MGLAPVAAGQDEPASNENLFSDVTEGTHKPAIDALGELGVFEGTLCGEETFCPIEPIKRSTMAVWLIRALEGDDPPAITESRFADVDDDAWWAPFVERLAELEITVGCRQEPLRFCPDRSVSRGQMASFLVRALDLEPAGPAGFTDIEGNTHTDKINALFAAGITVGCRQDPLRYCPARPVTREQMATLLRRGLDHRGEADPFSIEEGPRGNDTLISASRGRTCAVRLDGGLACWGADGVRERFALAGLQSVVAVSTGDNPLYGLHACVLHEDRTVSCWGSGLDGKLGQGNTSSHYLPVAVPGITDVVAVSAGGEHTCTVHSDGGLSCWGDNLYGQLGVGNPRTGYLPQRVPGLSDVAAVAAGLRSTCAVHRDGALSCWGWPSYSANSADSTPSRFEGPGDVTSVSIGQDGSCATTVSGAVYCWPSRQTPADATRVGNLTDVVEVSVGDGTVCGLHRDGGVSCWGENNAVGQVGDGTTTPRHQPVRLAGISDAVAVSVSAGISDAVAVSVSLGSPSLSAHACALHEDGSASCWGGNEIGQLGDGTTDNRLVPTRAQRSVRIPADQAPDTGTHLLRAWAEAAVQEREAEYPWMRVAWDHIRDGTWAVQSGFGGQVFKRCYASADVFGCRTDEMHITAMSLGTIVHELLHVYDLNTGLAPSTPWGAVQLYFATTYPGCYAGDGVGGAEILADTVNHLMVPGTWLTYYNSDGCPTLPPHSEPTLEAEQVVLQGLAGRVPDWYTENITNSAELWAAWLRGPSLPALANLAGEFGGLCSTDWITYPFDPELFPAADSNPFRDGGC